MKPIKFNLFELISLGWISLAILSLLAALLGIFYIGLILVVFIFLIFLVFRLWKNKKIKIVPLEKRLRTIFILIALVAFCLSFFTTPTIFGGRDEGSYSNAAIMLVKDHSLKSSNHPASQFFEIYKQGKALNFPGFYYTSDGKLTSMFPPGYISFIGFFFGIGGILAIKLVNFFPFLTFFGSIFLLLQRFSREKKLNYIHLIGLLFFLTCFPFAVFYKLTLTELFFGSLAWFALYLMFRYFENKIFLNYAIIFIPLALMLFSRIEAIALVFMTLLIFILKDFNHIRIPRYQLLFAGLGLCFIIAIALFPDFFIDSAKNIAEPLIKSKKNSISVQNPISDDWKSFFLIKVFFVYNILPFIFIGTIYIIKLFNKKEYDKLIPLIFFSPTFIYLADASISLDHPWMLRRFIFSIIPIFIFYTFFLLEFISYRKIIFYLASAILIVTNIYLIYPFITFSQNQNLMAAVQKLDSQFKSNDLILVGQKSSGSGWSLMSEPLRNIYGKNAVYFFNPNDLKKINRDTYENTYLVISENEEALFKDIPKRKVNEYQIQNSIINPLRDPLAIPSILEFDTKGSIYKLN